MLVPVMVDTKLRECFTANRKTNYISFKMFCEDISFLKLWLIYDYDCGEVSPHEWQVYKIPVFMTADIMASLWGNNIRK